MSDNEMVQKYSQASIRQFSKLTKRYNTDQSRTFDASVHIVQDERGSGVNIADDGLSLTCAHCLMEDQDSDDDTALIGVKKIVVFADGRMFEAVCTVASIKQDLAIMKIHGVNGLPTADISTGTCTVDTEIVCVGNPSEYDLESNDPDATVSFYPPVFHCSSGKVEGYCGGDLTIMTKSGLGKLKHGCWTYWGHSGAPIFNVNDSTVVGIHNSWDDTNGQRHGIPLRSIQHFLKITVQHKIMHCDL